MMLIRPTAGTDYSVFTVGLRPPRGGKPSLHAIVSLHVKNGVLLQEKGFDLIQVSGSSHFRQFSMLPRCWSRPD